MNELKVNPQHALAAVLIMARLLAAFAIVQGLFITMGGADRWSSPAFKVALFVPGAPPAWGVLLGLAGIVSLYGSLRCRLGAVVAGMFSCALWSVFFAISFAAAAIRDAYASTTGVWAYSLIAVMYALIGIVYRESRRLNKSAVHRDHA